MDPDTTATQRSRCVTPSRRTETFPADGPAERRCWVPFDGLCRWFVQLRGSQGRERVLEVCSSRVPRHRGRSALG
jgi:hypothetical protein